MGAPPNLLATLYDMDFKRFLGEGAVRFLYWLTVILASLFAAVYLIGAIFSGRPFFIIIAIILVPIFYLLQLVYARVILEALTLVFRMSGDVRALLVASGGGNAPGGGGGGGGGPTQPWTGPTDAAAAPDPDYQAYPQDPAAPKYPSYPEDPGFGARPEDSEPDPNTTIDDDEPWIT